MTDISNNPAAIVAICIAASGFMICAGLGMSRILGDSDSGWKEQSDVQKQHMSEVRRRYIEMLKYEAQ
jgi:hypothetical protein